MERHGIERRIRARSEHFTVIPEIVRSTGLAAIRPASVAIAQASAAIRGVNG